MTHRCSREDGAHQWEGMFKKVRCLTRPTQARQDAPFHGQGRSHFDARSVLIVREHERREERQVCEPEGSAKGRPACAKPLQQARNALACQP